MINEKIREKSIPVMSIMLAAVLLTSCGNYKPPYERGYDEGYQAGYVAAGGNAAEAETNAAEAKTAESSAVDPAEAEAVSSGQEEETVTQERSILQTIVASKNQHDQENEGAADEGSDPASEIEEGGTEAVPEDAESGEVLGDGSEPNEGGGGSAGIPDGRIISADAVNEALYSHPEVIDGLREIYADTAIFGEYVGDSETHLLHRVDGPHFAELTYNTIVVFDGSKSLDEILSEGFYSPCSCIE